MSLSPSSRDNFRLSSCRDLACCWSPRFSAAHPRLSRAYWSLPLCPRSPSNTTASSFNVAPRSGSPSSRDSFVVLDLEALQPLRFFWSPQFRPALFCQSQEVFGVQPPYLLSLAALIQPFSSKGGNSEGRLEEVIWKTRSGLERSLRRLSPRSRNPVSSGNSSPTNSWVARDSNTCPPCPAERSLATLFREGPK